MGSNVMFVIYGLYIRMFLLPTFNLKKGIVKPVLNDFKAKKRREFWVWRTHWAGLCILKPLNVSPSFRDIIVSMLWNMIRFGSLFLDKGASHVAMGGGGGLN